MACKLLSLIVLIIASGTASAIPVTGKVTDKNTRQSIELANVFLSGTTLGTHTNTKGEFTLNVPQPGKY